MIREKLRWVLSLALRFNLFEKLRQCPRIVAGVVEHLRPNHIGLRLRTARVPQQHSARAESPKLRQQRATRIPSENGSKDSYPRLRELSLGRLACPVSQRHVRELMRHHSRKLRFVV